MQDLSMPFAFVWTKFGTESGEPIEEIFARKERERTANGGIFLWGIGNNVGNSIRALSPQVCPEVLFSPIASPARACDKRPEIVAKWTVAESLEGEPFEIPPGSVVKSRWIENKRHHFALVCHSDTPLVPTNGAEHLYAEGLRNLVSGRKVGSSQVTSVVERVHPGKFGRAYSVALRIKLVAPYLVRLSNPVEVKVNRDSGREISHTRIKSECIGVSLLQTKRKPLLTRGPRK